MNQQDKSFLITFTVVISVLVMISVAIFLAAQMVSLVSVEPDDGSRAKVAAEERIKPVAQVAVADPNAKRVASAEQSPEQIYGSVCAACHDAGVLQAPKTGAQEDWEPRFAQGLDTLVTHAVNGINAMPAKGGNPNLSDEDIRKTIVYMLEKSGIQVSDATAAPDATATPAASESSPQTVAMETPPALNEGAAAQPQKEESAGKSIVPANLDLASGQKTYDAVCSVCHAQGVANAPKLGDTGEWTSRIEKGWDTLVKNSLKGFNAMPAKGGRVDLPDEQIISAVGYMLSESK